VKPRDGSVYFGSHKWKIDLRRDAEQFLASQQAAMKKTIDFDSFVAVTTAQRLSEWVPLQGTVALFKTQSRRSLETRSMIRIGGRDDVFRPLHAYAHLYLGTLSCSVGTLDLLLVGPQMAKESPKLQNFWFSALKNAIRSMGRTLPHDLSSATNLSSWGTHKKGVRQTVISVQTFQEVGFFCQDVTFYFGFGCPFFPPLRI
jgi:hypothetical protein